MSDNLIPLLVPLREACPPRLAERLESYAADLGRAMADEIATRERAADFFRRSHITRDIRSACAQIFDRLANGDASNSPSIYRFNSRFGGGKTHTLITLAAIARHPLALADAGDSAPLPPQAAVEGARLACFNGQDADVINGMPLDGIGGEVRAKSLIGAIGYALGGRDGFERAREYDDRLTAPGKEELRQLIGDKPMLILVDELAQWVEKAMNQGAAGVNNVTTALSAVMGAVAASPKAVMVVAAQQIGVDAFSQASGEVTYVLDELKSILDRQVQDFTPVSDVDMPAILRRRLFESVDEDARRAAADRYGELWRGYKPADAADMRERVFHSYPFHPSLIDIIQNRLSSNAGFQRTRGALRLMSCALAGIDGEAALAHPHHITPRIEPVRVELIDRLGFAEFVPAVKADITDAGSAANRAADGLVGKTLTTALLGSLTRLANAGLSDSEIVDATLSPADPDAGLIRKAIIDARSTALYISDDSRGAMRFSTEFNVRRAVRDREANFESAPELDAAMQGFVEETFGQNRGGNVLPAKIYPSITANLTDDARRVHLGVINPSYTYDGKDTLEADLRGLNEHESGHSGAATRQHRNHALWLVAVDAANSQLREWTKRYLAAQETARVFAGELKPHQEDILAEIIASARKNCFQATQSNWSVLYFPSNDSERWQGSRLRREELTDRTDREGDGQLAVLGALRYRNKAFEQGSVKLNGSVWRRMHRLNNPAGMSMELLRREFSAIAGAYMLLNDDEWTQLLDFAVDEGHIVVRSAAGEQRAGMHRGLPYEDDYVAWLPQHAPAVAPPEPQGADAGDIWRPGGIWDMGGDGDDGVADQATAYSDIPAYEKHGVSASVHAADLEARISANKTGWDGIAHATLSATGKDMLDYLASAFQGGAQPLMSYELHSADRRASLIIKNQTPAEWMGLRSQTDSMRRKLGERDESAVADFEGADAGDLLRRALAGMGNDFDVHLRVDFAPKSEEAGR